MEDSNIVIGLKLYIGSLDMGEVKSSDFVNGVTLKLKTDEDLGILDSTGIYKGANKLTCKYYDDEEGYMYVTFDKEVEKGDLPYFEEEEMIFKKIEE